MKNGVESRYFVEAAAKILDVLESFTSEDEEVSITEVARRAGSTYSSAFRLLYTLEKRGYVMRRPGKKRYILTPARRRFRIGYAALQTSNFQQEVTWRIGAAARRLGIVLLVRKNDEFNVSKALANADDLLAENINLLIEYQYNETASHLIAAKCHEAGIPAIAINFAQPAAYYFGGNNYRTGVLAGEFLCQFARNHRKAHPDVCLMLPANGLGSTQEARKAGLLDSLKNGQLGLRSSEVMTAPPALSVKEAYAVTKSILRELGRSKRLLIAALTDPLGIGAEKAVKEAGIENQVVIIGQGGGRDARDRIAKGGPFRASVAFFPECYGERVMLLALKILEGQKLPLASHTNHLVLTAENVKQYYPDGPNA